MNERFVIENENGNYVTLSSNGVFKLRRHFGGFETKPEHITDKIPFRDGSNFLHTVMSERDIDFHVTIVDDDLFSQKQHLSNVLNPKQSIRVTYYNDTYKRTINGRVSEPPQYRIKGSASQDVNFSIVCHEPYWTDDEYTFNNLIAYEGLFGFPLELPTQIGVVGASSNVNNDGNVPCPVFLTIHGGITNPKLTNETTGEYIKINETIQSGEKFVINTAHGKKSVTKIDADGIETNAFHKIDLTTTFWHLIPGMNTISYASDDSDTNANVTMKYKQRYLTL